MTMLIDICSLKILDNISVIISTKTYVIHTNASLSFYLVQAFGTAIGFVNLSKRIVSFSISINFHVPLNFDQAIWLL